MKGLLKGGVVTSGLQATVPLDGLGVKRGEGAGGDGRGRREEKETLGWPNGTPSSAPESPRPPQGEAHSAPRHSEQTDPKSGVSAPRPLGLSEHQPPKAPEARVRVQDNDVGTDLTGHQVRASNFIPNGTTRGGLPVAGDPALHLVANPGLQ